VPQFDDEQQLKATLNGPQQLGATLGGAQISARLGEGIPGPVGPEGPIGPPGPPGPAGIPLQVNTTVIGEASSGPSAGGGAAISTGTFASLPPSPSDPAVYYFTDSVYTHAVYESGAWKYFIGGFQCIPPVDADFAWVNQGTATVTGNYGGVYMDVPPVGSMNIRIRKKAAPATPYAIHAAFMPNLIATNFSTLHLGFRNAAGGGLMHLRYGWFNGWHFDRAASVPTTDSSAGFVMDPYDLYRPFHIRISDNGTNTSYSYSLDGRVWIQLVSEPRGTFLTTPDEVWWGVDNRYGAGTNSVGAYLIHWKQT
jgi:hypothetical protein